MPPFVICTSSIHMLQYIHYEPRCISLARALDRDVCRVVFWDRIFFGSRDSSSTPVHNQLRHLHARASRQDRRIRAHATCSGKGVVRCHVFRRLNRHACRHVYHSSQITKDIIPICCRCFGVAPNDDFALVFQPRIIHIVWRFRHAIMFHVVLNLLLCLTSRKFIGV